MRTLDEKREAGHDVGQRACKYVCEYLNEEKRTGMYVATIHGLTETIKK